MTIRALQERRDVRPVTADRAEPETRASVMAGWPNGYGWQDPSAIPPPGLYSQQRAGVPVTIHTTLQVDAVFTALRVITNAIIKLGNPRAYTVAYDPDNYPYYEFLNPQPAICTNTFGKTPNGGLWQYDGIARTVMSLALFGEAFWCTLTRKGKYPTSIEVLDPAFVEVRPVKNQPGSVEYWYGSGTSKVQLDNNDVTHIPFLAMPSARRGLNSIEYGGVAFALALAAMEFGQRWFAQGASPSYILSTDQKLGQEEVSRIAEKFLIEHSGLQAAHLPLVVDNGLKVEKVGSTPDEAQYTNTLDYSRMCIAAWFGLPSHLVGGSADKGNVWGKACSLDTPIPTPSGWTVMGDIELGDWIFGSDGKPAEVTYLSPVFLGNDCYRLTFSDESTIVADADHGWVAKRSDRELRRWTTREIAEYYSSTDNSKHHRLHIALAEPLDLPDADLLIDPYILGYWLGDGTSAGGEISVGDEDLAEVTHLLEQGPYPVHVKKYPYHRASVAFLKGLRTHLRELNLLKNKHIPAAYFRGSAAQRLALLQGLMDSDGSGGCGEDSCNFSNINERLANDALCLARTLGLRPLIRKYHNSTGAAFYRVKFQPRNLPIFRIERKAARCSMARTRRASTDTKSIVKIEKVESVPTRCLTVNNNSHLFLAGDAFTVTSNTVQEQAYQMIDFTLSGYLVRMEEAWSSLCPPLADKTPVSCKFIVEDLQRANYTDTAAYLTAVRTATVTTPNEWRVRHEHMKPLPDGDALNAPLASNAPPPGAGPSPAQSAAQEDSSGEGAEDE